MQGAVLRGPPWAGGIPGVVEESLGSCGGEGGNHRTLCPHSVPSPQCLGAAVLVPARDARGGGVG